MKFPQRECTTEISEKIKNRISSLIEHELKCARDSLESSARYYSGIHSGYMETRFLLNSLK